MEEAWRRLKRDTRLANTAIAADNDEAVAASRARLSEAIKEVTARCCVERKRMKALEAPVDLSDDALVRAARFVDGLPLAPFENLLHLVPRLVNVVTVRSNGVVKKHTAPASRPVRSTSRLTHNHHVNVVTRKRAQLAEAVPCPGSGLKLPLDLHYIASRCSNSYFAPRRRGTRVRHTIEHAS